MQLIATLTIKAYEVVTVIIIDSVIVAEDVNRRNRRWLYQSVSELCTCLILAVQLTMDIYHSIKV